MRAEIWQKGEKVWSTDGASETVIREAASAARLYGMDGHVDLKVFGDDPAQPIRRATFVAPKGGSA